MSKTKKKTRKAARAVYRWPERVPILAAEDFKAGSLGDGGACECHCGSGWVQVAFEGAVINEDSDQDADWTLEAKTDLGRKVMRDFAKGLLNYADRAAREKRFALFAVENPSEKYDLDTEPEDAVVDFNDASESLTQIGLPEQEKARFTIMADVWNKLMAKYGYNRKCIRKCKS